MSEWWKLQLRVLACVLFMGVLVGFVYTHNDDVTDNEYIDVVKNGSLEYYPQATVSTAFNYYFIKPYWRYYEAKTDEHVVELSGNANFDGEEGEVVLQFIVEEDLSDFHVGAMKFSDVVQEREDKLALVNAVYEIWNEREIANN